METAFRKYISSPGIGFVKTLPTQDICTITVEHAFTELLVFMTMPKSFSLRLSSPRHLQRSPQPRLLALYPRPHYISTISHSPQPATHHSTLLTTSRNFLLGTSILLSLSFGYLYFTDVRAGVHQWAVVPGLRWWYDDAEEAHERGTEILEGLWRWGLYPRERSQLKEREGESEGERLGVEVSEWVPEPRSRYT